MHHVSGHRLLDHGFVEHAPLAAARQVVARRSVVALGHRSIERKDLAIGGHVQQGSLLHLGLTAKEAIQGL